MREERGTSTEYVAERMRKKPNPYTIEGMIDGIGALSLMAVEEPNSENGLRARKVVLILLVPFVISGVLEIVGVAADTKMRTLGEGAASVFYTPNYNGQFLVRVAGDEDTTAEKRRS